jgi:hypothetical protein
MYDGYRKTSESFKVQPKEVTFTIDTMEIKSVIVFYVEAFYDSIGNNVRSEYDSLIKQFSNISKHKSNGNYYGPDGMGVIGEGYAFWSNKKYQLTIGLWRTRKSIKVRFARYL